MKTVLERVAIITPAYSTIYSMHVVDKLAHHDSGCWVMARHRLLVQLFIHGAPTEVVWVEGTT